MGVSPTISAESAVLNPHVVAGSSALVIALLSLLVYLYRRRLFILWWMSAWLLLAASMLMVARNYSNEKLFALTYGLSQFMGVLASLAFVVAADAYRQRPRLKREIKQIGGRHGSPVSDARDQRRSSPALPALATHGQQRRRPFARGHHERFPCRQCRQKGSYPVEDSDAA